MSLKYASTKFVTSLFEGVLGVIGELILGATYKEDLVAFPIDALVTDLTTEDGGKRMNVLVLVLAAMQTWAIIM
jgi:Kef-type K+ transport system membrane component KefB